MVAATPAPTTPPRLQERARTQREHGAWSWRPDGTTLRRVADAATGNGLAGVVAGDYTATLPMNLDASSCDPRISTQRWPAPPSLSTRQPDQLRMAIDSSGGFLRSSHKTQRRSRHSYRPPASLRPHGLRPRAGTRQSRHSISAVSDQTTVTGSTAPRGSRPRVRQLSNDHATHAGIDRFRGARVECQSMSISRAAGPFPS